jgi:hypothetical protein
LYSFRFCGEGVSGFLSLCTCLPRSGKPELELNELNGSKRGLNRGNTVTGDS